MKKVTEKKHYDVLFLGTRFVDGHYTVMQDAIDVAVRHQERFPLIRCVPVEILVPYRILDEDFWANNVEELQKIDLANARLGKEVQDISFYKRYDKMIRTNDRYAEHRK
tara:strand:- start:1401 stop:1727 length:327 start_codon:yes stop_codon:yes gene_type:complete